MQLKTIETSTTKALNGEFRDTLKTRSPLDHAGHLVSIVVLGLAAINEIQD